MKEFKYQVERAIERLSDIGEKQQALKDCLAGKTDWRTVEDAKRLLFRLSQLGMSDTVAEVMDDYYQKVEPLNVLERIIQRNELMGVSFLIKGASVAKTVGRVIICSGNTVLGHGTGFMVSPRLMLTNKHVLSAKSDAVDSLIEFNFRDTPIGITPSVRFKLLPYEFFFNNKKLDFALVAVEEINDGGRKLSEFGWNKLIQDSGKAVVGEHVNIIQHPAAQPKQVAIRQNTIVSVKDDFVHYLTDTRQGSSGSAVYNDQWDVVALHHAGVPEMDAQGNYLLQDGSIWDGSQSTVHLISWVANEGVRISKILDYLDDLTMDFNEQVLFQELLTATPVHQNLSASGYHQSDVMSLPTPSVPSVSSTQVENDGSSSWYFRLNFAPVNFPPANFAPVNNMTVKNKEHGAASLVTQLVTQDEKPYYREAVKMLEDAQIPGAYYDEEKDKAIRESYYNEIDFEMGRGELFDVMSKLLSQTHQNKLSYRNARLKYLYPVVDRRESGSLRNVYSGTIIDPLEIIRSELVMIHQYERILQDRMATGELDAQMDIEEAMALLEAQQAFNCEHVVPQSWFGKAQPMKGDLHHLFACEPKCNSFRSNIPYYQFNPLEEAVRADCGRREGDKFEPEMGHGAVARATLYFLLRYPGLIGNEQRELQKQRLAVVVDWHKRYPVSLYELHRNSTIYAAQGNRNPFIDRPGLVDEIDIAKGFGALVAYII